MSDISRWWHTFWFEFRVSPLKLRLFRIGLFSVLALDAWNQIKHAPRYGAGGFNVSHIPQLDWLLPMPTRAGLLIVFILQAFLAARVVFGVAVGTSIKLITALYAYAYFISQLDSYQHHYFVFLVLLLCCFVPWDEVAASAPDKGASKRLDSGAEGASSQTGPKKQAQEQKQKQKQKPKQKLSKKKRANLAKQKELAAKRAAKKAERAHRQLDNRAARRITTWAIRLLLVQMSVMYFWAAMTKTAPLWLDGTALERQLSKGFVRDTMGSIGFGNGAVLVMITELFLVGALCVRRLWPLAFVVGVSMHIAFDNSGLEIGLFSYFMVGLYVLLIPDGWFDWLGKHARRGATGAFELLRKTRALIRWLPWWMSLPPVAVGSLLLFVLPFRETGFIVGVVALLGVVAAIPWKGARLGLGPGLAHLLACTVLLTFSGQTKDVHDYYKYWGGTSRRLGDDAGKKAAYAKLVKISPWYGSGHYHHGTVLEKEGKLKEALESYRRTQQLRPDYWRAFLAEANLHDRAGRGPEALKAARRVLQLRNDSRARDIYNKWAAKQAQPRR